MASPTSLLTKETLGTHTTERMAEKIDGVATTLTPTPPTGWKSLSPMFSKRGMAGGVCIDNGHQFLVIGGSEDFDDDDSHLSSCEYYEAKTGKWNRLRIDVPAARSGCGVASYGDHLFVMGGMTDPETFRSDLLTIDFGGDLANLAGASILSPRKWERLPPMKSPRGLFSCVMHSKYIYVIGGIDEDRKALDTVERYNVEAKTWHRLPNMPTKRFGCAAGVVGNKIYVVGGEDIDDNELATTSVFNLSEQQWESSPNKFDSGGPLCTPPVADMKERRGMLSVVAVDRFIVAIGGGDEDGNLLSTIEVLDTSRNIWITAPRRMNQGNCYTVVGFMKGTNEIIVAGGANEEEVNVTNIVDSIHFENGILPARFRVKDRGQKITADMDRGKDHLGVSTIAKALAETLVFKDLEPPFVLGILGKSGQGKTYFSNLMVEHLVSIQKQPLDTLVRSTFAGHIYVVKFDAWTYSKGSIFSSLVYEIFRTLNEQLQFEEEMGDRSLEAGDVSTLEVFRDLSSGKSECMKKHSKFVRETYLAVKKNGDRASEILLKVMNSSYKQDQEDLRRIKIEMYRIRTKRIREQTRRAVAAIDRFVVEQATQTALKTALERKLIPGEEKSIEELIDNFENSGDYNNLIKEIKKIKWWNYRFRASNIPPFAWICSAFFLVLAGVLYLIFEDAIVITLTGLMCLGFPVIGNFSSISNRLNSIIIKLEDEATRNEDVEVGSFDKEDLAELKSKEEKTYEIENRSLALKGRSLRDTIASKIDSKVYERNVGIVHKVQQDLQHFSDTMLKRRDTDILFPRGDPRIVLLVEDLDRCEPSVVVEVIEALQLLVKTKLFVSVLAIDPRYATLSLEKHYKGVLNPNSPLSGMAFVEKIIQIPFCLPGVGLDYVDSFVKSQIDVEEPRDASESFEIVVDDQKRDSISVLSSTSSKAFDFQVPKLSSRVAKRQDDKALPKDRILFTEEELAMITEMLKLFGLGPRSMRRNINVFKVLSVIWKRDSVRFEVDYNLKRATLFLMLLSSEETTREVTCNIFELMELGMVKYHRVMQDSEGALQDENNLSNLFKTELQKQDKSFVWNFGLSSSNESSKKGTLVAHIEEYLVEYSWASFDEWNGIASKFLLARCFSFSQFSTKGIETRHQALNTNQRMMSNHREANSKWNYVDFTGGIFDSGRGSRDESSIENEPQDIATGKTHDLRWNSSPDKSSGARGLNKSNGDHYNGVNGHNGHNGRKHELY